MKFPSRTLVLALVSVAIASPAYSASVNKVTGEVMASSGGAYTRIKSGTVLKPGASVFANPGGQAKLVYSENCVVDVAPGTVVWVYDKPPCEGSGAGPSSGAGGMGMGVGAMGAVAVVGGLVTAVAVGGKSKTPASP